MDEVKFCGYCKRQLTRHYKESDYRWVRRKFCNRSCGGRASGLGGAAGENEEDQLSEDEVFRKRVQLNIQQVGKRTL